MFSLDYSEDEDEKKLSRYMKKSLNIGGFFILKNNNTIEILIFFPKGDKSYYDEDDSENDDFDEYKNDDQVPSSYKIYKKNLLKEKF